MSTLFLVCAAFGGTLLICQFVAGLLGIGADHDVDTDSGDLAGDHDLDTDHEHADHVSNWFFGLLTFRSIVSALLFFGLGGLSAGYYGLERMAQMGVAVASGLAALYIVASIMNFFKRLRHDGAIRIKKAIGQTGTVYLRIPAENSGMGKVTLNMQNRTVELDAYTAHAELPTGTPIVVVAVRGPDCVEVQHLTPEA